MESVLISQAEYARRRGVSKEAVRKAIDTKRITPIPQGSKLLIDPVVADIQWARNTNPDQQARGAPAQFETTQARANAAQRGSDSAAEGPATGSKGDADPMLVQVKTATETLRHNLLEIELAEKRGELVRRDDVVKAHAQKLMSARDLLEGIADRVAAKFAAESSAEVIHRELVKEIRIAMSGVAQLAAEGVH